MLPTALTVRRGDLFQLGTESYVNADQTYHKRMLGEVKIGLAGDGAIRASPASAVF